MCSVKVYEKFNRICSDYVSSGGGGLILDGPTNDALKSLCNTLNFIGIWLKQFGKNKFDIIMIAKRNEWVVQAYNFNNY